MRPLAPLLLYALTAWATAGHAEELTLRMASAAPEGTAWARELRALARDIGRASNDRVRMKWYLGGIAGDDLKAGERIKRDQLDGVGAGAWQCERWAPSMAVTRLPGLFHDRAESKYVAARLRDQFDAEFRRAGLVYLGETELGPSLVFTRERVYDLDELRRLKLWTLDTDPTKTRLLRALGLQLVPLPFDESRRAYDDRRVDGFLGPPSGALAFQWSTQARYLLALPTDYIVGCLVVSTAAFDRMPLELQQVVRAASAKFLALMDEVGARADEELLGGLFERQGLKITRPDAGTRASFDAASRALWEQLKEPAIPPALLKQAQELLSAYRAAKSAAPNR